MNKDLRKFFSNYQNFLRQCSRFGNVIVFSFDDNFIQNDENEIVNENDRELNVINEANQNIYEEIDYEKELESAKNFAFEVILDENSNDQMTIQALSLLYDIVSDLRRDTNIFYRDDICFSIIDLLYHQNLVIVVSTLKLILLLTQGSRNPVKLLIKNDLLSALIILFNQMPDYLEDDTIFHFILLISSNIAYLSSKKVHYLIQLDYSQLLYKAIEEGSINIQIAAAYLSSNIMTKGSKSDIEETINLLVVNHLFEFLDEDYEPCLFHCILDGIDNCLQNDFSIEDTSFKQILQNEQYLTVLYSLLTKSDEDTLEQAQHIISLIEDE